jgi:hypothetical protein
MQVEQEFSPVSSNKSREGKKVNIIQEELQIQ